MQKPKDDHEVAQGEHGVGAIGVCMHASMYYTSTQPWLTAHQLCCFKAKLCSLCTPPFVLQVTFVPRKYPGPAYILCDMHGAHYTHVRQSKIHVGSVATTT